MPGPTDSVSSPSGWFEVPVPPGPVERAVPGRVDDGADVAATRGAARVGSGFFGLFSALGLLLSSVGLSGTLAYAVARRTKEIGIRIALGADRAAVLKMIIGEGLALTLVGIAIGLLLALALTRALTSYLYGISAADPLTYLATTLILIIVAMLACYFPARRAADVDPMTALRHD